MDAKSAAVLVWLEGERQAGQGVDHVVARFAVRVRAALPVDSVGVTIGSSSTPTEIVGSDDRALRLGRLQPILDDGPGPTSAASGHVIEIPDLRDERRFGAYVALALASGIAAVTSIPLRHGGAHLGALDLYRSRRGRLDPASMADARLLADGLANFVAPDVALARSGVAGAATPVDDIIGGFLDGSITVRYQPMVSFADGHVVGAESLLQWRHPELGALGPFPVLRLAERSGCPIEVTRGVLGQVCADLARWSTAPAAGEYGAVTVNVSVAEFSAPGFFETVVDVLHSTGTDPASIALDLPESVVLGPLGERLVEVTGRLAGYGIHLWLNDLGTWYTSLDHLDPTVVDVVKIGPVFVSGVDDDEESRAIIASIVALAGRRGLKVHAVGVERESQRDVLAALGCDSFQGNLEQPPVPAAEFEHYLRTRGSTVRHVVPARVVAPVAEPAMLRTRSAPP